MNKYYLRIENDKFGFVVEGIHEIDETTDYAVTQEEYNKFFELQSEGKQFRVKADATGVTLFDLIEEYTPKPLPPAPPSEAELLKQRIELLENENADLLLDSVNKDIRLEQNENDIADLLLVVGGM
ncbi:hypothetical protein H8S10_11960 [Clostridium sp. NSJ-49]|uniref:hypothetical protein n=1 Tax=Clostridium TaxID=1485 RepID=UPI00164B9F79|nr:hypothetical protein [Clostridium sp. NSJ-49]MBC5626172.1 hypothetical protein [Clostridium sp. NSJ-49]